MQTDDVLNADVLAGRIAECAEFGDDYYQTYDDEKALANAKRLAAEVLEAARSAVSAERAACADLADEERDRHEKNATTRSLGESLIETCCAMTAARVGYKIRQQPT